MCFQAQWRGEWNATIKKLLSASARSYAALSQQLHHQEVMNLYSASQYDTVHVRQETSQAERAAFSL